MQKPIGQLPPYEKLESPKRTHPYVHTVHMQCQVECWFSISKNQIAQCTLLKLVHHRHRSHLKSRVGNLLFRSFALHSFTHSLFTLSLICSSLFRSFTLHTFAHWLFILSLNRSSLFRSFAICFGKISKPRGVKNGTTTLKAGLGICSFAHSLFTLSLISSSLFCSLALHSFARQLFTLLLIRSSLFRSKFLHSFALLPFGSENFPNLCG